MGCVWGVGVGRGETGAAHDEEEAVGPLVLAHNIDDIIVLLPAVPPRGRARQLLRPNTRARHERRQTV